MGVASQVAAWEEEWTGRFDWSTSSSSSGTPPITFPTVPLRIKVELFLGGVWVDITSGPNGIYYETRVKIKRGRDNEATRAQPSSCKIKLKNPSRWWSPRNTAGPHYGKLGRNVRLRVTVNPGDKDYIRFTGFVSKWPQEWTTGDHRWVSLEANGILRRLNQGKAPLKTPILRSMESQNPYAYWPLADLSDATQAASSVDGGAPMFQFGDGVSFAGTTAPDGSPAVVIPSGALVGYVSPAVTGNSNGWVIGFGMKLTAPPLDADAGRSQITFFLDSTDFTKIDILPASSDGLFPVQAVMLDPSAVGYTINMSPSGYTEAQVNTLYDGQWHYYQLIAVRTSATTMTVSGYYDGELQGSFPGMPLLNPTTGNVVSAHINPTFRDWTTFNLAFSNLSVLPTMVINNLADAFNAYIGESAIARYIRLCMEENIPYMVVETAPDTETMGPQGTKSIMDLLRECEATNEGVIDEAKTGELRLISRTALWNQPPSMQIDYLSGAIQPGFIPTDDDLQTRNDWTITRQGGASGQWVQNTGPLNVNDPEDDPDGIFKYDDSATLSLETDNQPIQHAALRVAKGTIDEIRIAKMPLHFSQIAGRGLLASWLKMDFADTSGFWINNPPQDIGGQQIRQTMTGYDESIDRFEWTADISGTPATIDQGFGTADSFGFTDCDASFLAEDLDTTETSIDLQINDTCTWLHNDGDYRITIRGEEVLLTAVGAPVGAGTSWTQTITVVRSVNGVVLSHPIGTQIYITEPFIPVL